jgi:hypothetical protein
MRIQRDGISRSHAVYTWVPIASAGRSGSWLRRASWTGAVLGPGEADLVIACEDSHHNKEKA